MTPRHAVAFALVGWYLMVPPTADELDSTCAAPTLVPDMGWALSLAEINTIRCDSLLHEAQYDARVSKWYQVSVSSFETLEACQAEYEKNQAPVGPVGNEEEQSRLMAKLEFTHEGESHPSEEELQLRAKTIQIAVHRRVGDEKCIATDDPRLKGTK